MSVLFSYEHKPVHRTEYQTRYEKHTIPVQKTNYVSVKKVDYKPVTRYERLIRLLRIYLKLGETNS